MNNPYNILGVNQNATEDQIKEAYRLKAREFNNQYNSGSVTEEWFRQRMAELDGAYDNIMQARSSGAYYDPNAADAYRYNNGYNGTSQFNDVRSQIISGRINDAEVILDGIPNDMRNAEWYFLKGQIQHRRGWFDEAYNNYSRACQMDPQNAEYSAAFRSLNNKYNGGYTQVHDSSSSSCSACDICSGLICADCCCECAGGDLIPCC